MLVYSKYPRCAVNIDNYYIPGYLEENDPVDIPYKTWSVNRAMLVLAPYNQRLIKKIYGIEAPPISFTFFTIKHLSYDTLVHFQQHLGFELKYGRSLESYQESFKYYLRYA